MIYLECYSNYAYYWYVWYNIMKIGLYKQNHYQNAQKCFHLLQIHNLNHQKVSLEEMVAQERARATEQVAAMSQKLKDVQEMLFVKMREASTSHDCHMPLKAEISAMKALLEEEEKRSVFIT